MQVIHFFLWLTDGEHTNLKVLLSTIKSAVNQELTLRI